MANRYSRDLNSVAIDVVGTPGSDLEELKTHRGNGTLNVIEDDVVDVQRSWLRRQL